MVRHVGLFIPCSMDTFEPEVGIATLERLGCSVDYPAQHLAVPLDPDDIVSGLQDAYDRAEFHQVGYAVFHTGRSATGDIEGVLILGAQGVRTLTVAFIPCPRPGALGTVPEQPWPT
jgi:hypothetical protein